MSECLQRRLEVAILVCIHSRLHVREQSNQRPREVVLLRGREILVIGIDPEPEDLDRFELRVIAVIEAVELATASEH